jgi:hypothetical protein
LYSTQFQADSSVAWTPQERQKQVWIADYLCYPTVVYWDKATAKFGAKKVLQTPFGKVAVGGVVFVLVVKEVLTHPRASEALKKGLTATIQGIQTVAPHATRRAQGADAALRAAARQYLHSE